MPYFTDSDHNTTMEVDASQEERANQQTFLLGIGFLFGWILVIILCSSPQLFRDLILRYVLCWCCPDKDKGKQDKLQKQSQLRDCFAEPIASNPSTLLLQQVMGSEGMRLYRDVTSKQIDAIPEENGTESEVNPTDKLEQLAGIV